MSDKLYKIRRKSDGLYSTGGQYVYWTKKGKTWNSISALSSHLAGTYSQYLVHKAYTSEVTGINLDELPSNHPYKDCEIVEAEVDFKSKKSVENFLDIRYNLKIKANKAIEAPL